VNEILACILDGLKRDNHTEIRIAAFEALNSCFPFIATNFEILSECDTIMKFVCDATLSIDEQMRMRVFECLVTIARLYYDKLSRYFDTLQFLTAHAIRIDDEYVGMQAIEFWTIICEHESKNDFVCHNFVERAASLLIPLLRHKMIKSTIVADNCNGGEEEEEEEWNISQSASVCLDAISRVIGDGKMNDL
jgi:importin subunit beta-1